jgi:peptide/nickel transport system permease protein
MILAVAISSIPAFARLVRGVVLGTRELEYIEAARAIGEPSSAMLRRYLLPAAIGPIVIQTSLRMATVLLAAASLNFLGLGVQPPTPEWGSMLSNARSYMFVAPYLVAIPGLAITIVVLAFNLLGDGLRDALDPRFG